MNKTNHIISTIALCFFLSFFIFPVRASYGATYNLPPEYGTGATPGVPSAGTPANGGNGNGNGGNGLVDPNPINAVNGQNVTIEDINSSAFPDPNTTEVGDTFTGPSGTTYVANPTGDTIILNGVVTPVVIWEEVSGNGNGDDDKEWNCKVCNASNQCVYQTFSKKCDDACKTDAECQEPSPQAQYRCKQCRGTTCAIRYSNTPCADTCTTDANCASPAPTTRYSCNTSTWTCSVNPNSIYTLAECRIVCQPGGTLRCPGNDYCYACNKSTYQCYHSNSGTYSTLSGCQNVCKPPRAPRTTTTTSPPPTLPETQPCMINYFELPERAFVNQVIKGRWSASYWCEDCDVDCEPYPECYWKKESIGIGEIGQNEERFRIQQTGIYDYFLTCWGPGGIDERQETAQIEILNLPWWREIIPVLPKDL